MNVKYGCSYFNPLEAQIYSNNFFSVRWNKIVQYASRAKIIGRVIW